MISTERCIIRPLALEDALEVHILAKDPLVGPSCGWEPHTSLQESIEVIEELSRVKGTFTIVSKEMNCIVGLAHLVDYKESHLAQSEEEGELGCWIGSAFWHQGYAYEACRALLVNSKYKTIWAESFADNIGSIGLQKKLGFAFVYEKDGKRVSKYMRKEGVNFYLVRHGQTMFNKKGLVQGWCDAPLTELGIQQAKELGEKWDISNIEIAYSSTSERAVDTLDYIVRGRIPSIEHKGFKEINFGDYEGDKVSVVFPDGTVHIRSYEYIHGEDKDNAAERFLATMKEVAETSQCHEIMVVTHGSIIRELLRSLSTYYRENEMPTYKMVPNCSVTKIGLIRDEFELLESPKVY